MNTLVYLIPIALFLGGLGLVAFLWALRNGQYEDLNGAAWRVLDDGDDKPGRLGGDTGRSAPVAPPAPVKAP